MKYSREEIAKHNTQQSCWIIVDGQVADVTAYLPKHPGGRWIILEHGGKDATQFYKNQMHSEVADEILMDSIIGEVHDK